MVTQPAGHAGGSLTVVCSDSARNGKTLFAKLLADLMRLRTGVVPHLFDTDEPDGDLIHHYGGLAGGAGQIVDLARTRQQVALFDSVIGEPSRHFLLDLSARHRGRFFRIAHDIAFEDGVEEAGTMLRIFYVLDRDQASVDHAAELRTRFPRADFTTVRNGAIGDCLDDVQALATYQAMRLEREVLLPALSGVALGWLEEPSFHFDDFLAGRYDTTIDFDTRAELWGFLETMYAQRGPEDDAGAAPVV